MEVPRFAAVGLSLMLAANCFMPCYTLAYADESQGVPDVFEEEQKEVSDDANGLELSPGSGERVPYGSDGDSAAEGHGGDLEASEGTGQDTAPDNGGLDGAVVYDSELSADYPLVEEGGGGLDYSYGGNASDVDVVSGDGITAFATSADNIGWLLGNVAGGTSNPVKFGGWNLNANSQTLYWATLQIWSQLYYVAQKLDSANNYQKAIDTSSKNLYAFLTSQYDGRYFTTTLGYIYDALVANGNLASKGFDDIYKFLTSKIGDGYFTTWIYYIYDNGLKLREQNDRLYGFLSSQYDGRYFTTTLGYIYDALVANGNLASKGFDDIYSFLTSQYDGRYFTTTLGYIYNALVANGNLASKGFDDIYKFLTSKIGDGYFTTWIYYIYDNGLKLREQNDRLYGFLSSQYDGRYFTTTLGYIYNSLEDSRGTLVSSVQWSEVLHGDLSMLRHGAADLLPGYVDWTLWDFLQGIYFDLGNTVDLLKGLQQTLTAWGNRWDAQDLYLMEWAKRWDALDKGGSWSESDKGALFAKLDGISDRLSVEAGQTILDALIGEVKPQYINDQLTIVKEVARNRFPFCIPAMMQQMLGIMEAEAEAPCWEFDIWGSPLVVDFSDFEGLARVVRWASCFMLFLALLANTKNFIFDLGGGEK